jgi:hypothetical protein
LHALDLDIPEQQDLLSTGQRIATNGKKLRFRASAGKLLVISQDTVMHSSGSSQ